MVVVEGPSDSVQFVDLACFVGWPDAVELAESASVRVVVAGIVEVTLALPCWSPDIPIVRFSLPPAQFLPVIYCSYGYDWRQVGFV